MTPKDARLIITGSESGITVLRALIEDIKSLGNVGHSYEIILDPNGEKPIKHGWDGDGADSIADIDLDIFEKNESVDSIDIAIRAMREETTPEEILDEMTTMVSVGVELDRALGVDLRDPEDEVGSLSGIEVLKNLAKDKQLGQQSK